MWNQNPFGSTTPTFHKVDINIDVPVSFSYHPATWIDRKTWDMFDKPFTLSKGKPGDASAQSNVSYYNNEGWRLDSTYDRYAYQYEKAVSDDSFLALELAPPTTPGGSAVASYSAQATPEYLPFLGTTTTRTSGYPFHYIKQKAGDTDAVNWSDDQAVLPPPPDFDWVTLDRICRTEEPLEPTDSITITVRSARTGQSVAQGLAFRVYACFLPTFIKSVSPYPGTGIYAFEFWLDGTFELKEWVPVVANPNPNVLTDYKWVQRYEAVWCDKVQGGGLDQTIIISSDAVSDGNPTIEDRQYFGTTITVRTLNKSSISTGIEQSQNFLDTSIINYNIIQDEPTQPSNVLIPLLSTSWRKVRLDIRRDVSLDFNLSKPRFKETGFVWSKLMNLGYEPINNPTYGGQAPFAAFPITVTVQGTIPDGTNIDLFLFGYNPNLAPTDANYELSAFAVPGSYVVTSTYATRSFIVVGANNVGYQYYRALVVYTSTGGIATPRLNRFTAFRNPHYTTSNPTTVKAPIKEMLQIVGQSRDPSTAGGYVKLPDPSNVLAPILQKRARVPFDIRLYYDLVDKTKFSILQRGRIIKAPFRQIGQKMNQGFKNTNPEVLYPATDWGTYDATLLGEWTALERRRTPKTWNFAAGSPDDKDKPWKVTDIIRLLLQVAGYPPSQIDVPDIDQRLLFQGNKQDYLLELYSFIAPYICRLAHDYLNAYLVFDENATNLAAGGTVNDTMGCWRLKRAPLPNDAGKYRAVAAFSTEAPTVANYPTVVPGAFAPISDGRGGTIVPRFVNKSLYTREVEAPEGNYVFITGQGVLQTNASTSSFKPYLIQQTVYNWAAADFGQNVATGHPLPDPTNPDYTDGVPEMIYQCDPVLTTNDAVNWRARRVFDLACHSRIWHRFTAPAVLVTNPDDTNQIRPRLPMFGDIVLFNGTQCVVNNIFLQGDIKHTIRNLQCVYEIFEVPALELSNPNQLYRQIVSYFS